MKHSHQTKLLLLFAAVICLFFLSMCVGRYPVAPEDVLRYFTGRSVPETSARVLSYLRIPRTLLAILVGSSLSISGAIYQSAFQNKLISPDLLGVTSGASVGACLAILFGLSRAWTGICSFLVGFAAVFLTVGIAKLLKNGSHTVLLLSGIAVGGLMSSLVGLLKYLADNELKLAEMTFWLLGDISKTTMADVWLMLPITAIGAAVSCLLSWNLNLLSLGEREAAALGVPYRRHMGILIFTATLLTAGAVSVSGTIGWIGLVIPNIVRLVAGSDNRKVIPLSLLLGACFLMLTDMLARSLSPDEIPLGVITGILGTPLFLFSIFKKRNELL